MDDLNRRRPPLRPVHDRGRSVRTDEERERDTKLREHIEGVDWADVTARLTAAAHRMMRKRRPLADAQDVAQTAILQLLDPDYKDWNPDEKSLLEHLESVAWGIVRNRFVNVGERSTDVLDDVERKRVQVDPRPFEAGVASREIRDRVFSGLRARFARKPLETSLVELFAEGIHLPREQAQETGQPYATLYRARMRVIEEARRILAELENDHVED